MNAPLSPIRSTPDCNIPPREIGASASMVVPVVVIFAIAYAVSIVTTPPVEWLGSAWFLPATALVLAAVSVARRRYAACRIEDGRLRVERDRIVMGYRREEVKEIRRKRFFTGLASITDPLIGKEVDDELWAHEELSLEMSNGQTVKVLLPCRDHRITLLQDWVGPSPAPPPDA